jgi:hypothetical protein
MSPTSPVANASEQTRPSKRVRANASEQTRPSKRVVGQREVCNWLVAEGNCDTRCIAACRGSGHRYFPSGNAGFCPRRNQWSGPHLRGLPCFPQSGVGYHVGRGASFRRKRHAEQPVAARGTDSVARRGYGCYRRPLARCRRGRGSCSAFLRRIWLSLRLSILEDPRVEDPIANARARRRNRITSRLPTIPKRRNKNVADCAGCAKNSIPRVPLVCV